MIAMRASKLSTEMSPDAHPKAWPQKLRREFGRFKRQLNTIAMRPVALTARNRFLFILGHMRSGSSLLCHLLCSSDDIIGFGEAHNDYRRRSDLSKLLAAVRHYTGKNPLQYRYVLDKVVGVQHVLSDSLLSDQRTRYVFLVREPMATIASLIAMRQRYHNETLEQLVAFATSNYTQRLAQLVQIGQTVDDPRRCLIVTHGQLIDETSATFAALEDFLDLRAPLREEYRVMPTTGQPGIGDPSPNIRRGKIDRSLPRKEVDLTGQMRAELEERYETCIKELRERVQSLVSHPPARNTNAA
jgi:hypothetical protein